MATVLIGADICPIEGNRSYFLAGDATSLFHDLLPEFAAADLVIANLEGPLVEVSTPIRKTGPTFGEPSGCLNGILAAGIDVLSLANNHIMDHGATGLKNTLVACERAGIATVGAGKDLAQARQILIRKVGELRIGVLSVAEHEFSIATRDGYGASPLDLIDIVRNVTRHRDQFDYLIVLLHGGDEFFAPSPRLQETCRFLIEVGANAVIVQHPHCLGGYEEHQGGHIVYGQGALVMDEGLYRNRSSFHEGFLVKLRVGEGGNSTMELVPFRQSDPVPGARCLVAAEAEALRHRLAERSRAILDPDWLAAEWLAFCEARKHSYLSGLLGHNRVLRKLNSRGLISRLLYRKSQWLSVRNIVCCENHREAVETILNRILKR